MQKYPKIHFEVTKIREETQGEGGVYIYLPQLGSRLAGEGNCPPLGFAETTPLRIILQKRMTFVT